MSPLRPRGSVVRACWALAWASTLALTPGVASAEPPDGVRIAQMLRHWDVVAAEEALAAQVGNDDVSLEMLRAQLRFYQGDYDAALAGIDALDDRVDEGDPEWRRFVREVVAAKERRRALRGYAERLEQALARAGSPRAPGETLSGYADRLDAANSRHGHGPDTGDVIRTYAALRYGGMGDPAAVIAAVEGAARQGS